MNAIHRKRLLKLADFLAGPVARAAKRNKARKFDLSLYASSPKIGLTRNKCGTSACALGWASVVFPRTFKIGEEFLPGECAMIMDGKELSEPEDAKDFFGLTHEEAHKAFSADFERRTIPQEVAVLLKLAAGK